MTTLLGIDLEGKDVLVVGGGEVAARRVRSLLADGARVHVVAPEVCPAIEELASRGRLTWTVGRVQAAHVEGSWLVHTATGNAVTDAQVARWAEQWRVLCVNASDASAGTARGARSRCATSSRRGSARGSWTCADAARGAAA